MLGARIGLDYFRDMSATFFEVTLVLLSDFIRRKNSMLSIERVEVEHRL